MTSNRVHRITVPLARLFILLAAALVAGGCATTPDKATAGGKAGAATTAAAKEQPAKPKAPQVSKEALEAYRQAVALYRRYKQAGNFDYASLQRAFEKVLEIDPQMAEAHYNLGCIAEAIHDDKQAERHYRQALSIRPDLAPAAANWGALLARHGKLDRALQVYRRALSKDAKNSAVLLNMAAIYHRQKRYDQALKAASEVLVRDPSNVGAYRIMASIYYDKKDFDMARLICMKGLKVKKQDPRLLNTLGLVLLQMGKVPQALANFRAALAQAPDMLGTRFNIAKVALDYKDFRVAREQFTKILEYQPDNRKAAVGLGISLRGAGQHEAARQHFQALTKRWPKWALPHYWLGVLALRNFNETKTAVAEFEQFIKMAGSRLPEQHPVFAALKEARQNIEMEKKMKEMERRAQEEARRRAELEKKLADERVRRLEQAWKQAEQEGGVLPPRKLDARQLPFVLIPPAISPLKNNRVTIYGMEFKGIKKVMVGNQPMKWKQRDRYTIEMLVPKWLGFKRNSDVYGPWDVTLFYKDKNADPIIFQGGLWVGKPAPKPKEKPKKQAQSEDKSPSKGQQKAQPGPGNQQAPASTTPAGTVSSGQPGDQPGGEATSQKAPVRKPSQPAAVERPDAAEPREPEEPKDAAGG